MFPLCWLNPGPWCAPRRALATWPLCQPCGLATDPGFGHCGRWSAMDGGLDHAGAGGAWLRALLPAGSITGSRARAGWGAGKAEPAAVAARDGRQSGAGTRRPRVLGRWLPYRSAARCHQPLAWYRHPKTSMWVVIAVSGWSPAS